MNALSLGPEMMGQLHGCKVGDRKTLSVPVLVRRYGKDGADLEVVGAPRVLGGTEPEDGGQRSEDGVRGPAVEAMLG